MKLQAPQQQNQSPPDRPPSDSLTRMQQQSQTTPKLHQKPTLRRHPQPSEERTAPPPPLTLMEKGAVLVDQFYAKAKEEEMGNPTGYAGRVLRLVRHLQDSLAELEASSVSAPRHFRSPHSFFRPFIQTQHTQPQPLSREQGEVLKWTPKKIFNFGNTCYLNAAAHCLYATEPLARYFIDKAREHAASIDEPAETLSLRFAQLMLSLHTTTADDAVRPVLFVVSHEL